MKTETQTTHRRDILSALFILSILSMMLIRIPYLALDFFLTLSIAVSLLILFVALNLKKPLDFSVFPTVLLLVTLFRLALSVAATRLILMDGAEFNGKIIQTLGSFLLYGNPVVGLVIFAVIFVVQMKVVTAGATRIAEVAARFTLDALPGKQLTLVSDMNAGLLSEEEAIRRRNELNQQADFYGAMDGAFRFVRGDAVANVFIAIINLVGGLLIGVFYSKLSFQEALGIYAVLTVGSGLASQVPALVISLASGLVITKASSSDYIGFDLKKQLFVNPKALQWTAAILLLLIVMGMPALPFLMLSVGIFTLGTILKRKSQETEEKLEETASQTIHQVEPPVLTMDAIEIEVGLSLIGFVESEDEDENLVQQISHLRRKLAGELGLIVPAVRVRDNLRLKTTEYRIKIRGGEVASGELELHSWCVIGAFEDFETQHPIVMHPALSLKCAWIGAMEREQAFIQGLEVLTPIQILMKHVEVILRRYAHELLTRQEVKMALEQLSERQPAVVEDIVPQAVSVTLLHRVLKNLLKEGIPVRDLVTILETLAERVRQSEDSDVLTEYVRQALARSISECFRSQGRIRVLALEPTLEEQILSFSKQSAQGLAFQNPQEVRDVVNRIREQAQKFYGEGVAPIVLCRPSARMAVRQLMEKVMPDLVVLSLSEITPDTELETQGVMSA